MKKVIIVPKDLSAFIPKDKKDVFFDLLENKKINNEDKLFKKAKCICFFTIKFYRSTEKNSANGK